MIIFYRHYKLVSVLSEDERKMNPIILNTELAIRDVHLPDSSLWWPLAPGWWILLLLIVLILLSFYIFKKTYPKRKLKKMIKLELEQYYQVFKETNDAQLFIQQLSSLLRRVSLYRFPADSIAKLQGVEWLEFLDSKYPSVTSGKFAASSFTSGVGKIFLAGPYQPIINNDVTPVYVLVKQWLKYNLKYKYGFM